MPKKTIDYSNTVFYKIVCRDLSITEMYVGHTTNFTKRKASHKNACNSKEEKYDNLKVYAFIRENGGWDNFDMIVIIKQNCIDSQEARTIERKYLEELNATLNTVIPSRTVKEYRILNNDRIVANRLVYNKANKDILREKRKEKIDKIIEYREVNKVKIKEREKLYKKKNCNLIKEKRKIYVELNKDMIKKQKMEKRLLNKDEINKKNRAKRELNKDEVNEKQRIYRAKQKLLKQQSLETNI